VRSQFRALAGNVLAGDALAGQMAVLNDADFELLRRVIESRSGLIVARDKTYLLESRLVPICPKYGAKDLAGLAGVLRKGSPAAEADVAEAMTTNETLFFRDKTPFDTMKQVILPKLMAARATQKSLRIWSAAASTGQEGYSIAIALREEPALTGWRIEIIGTDLSAKAIEKARAGIYTQFEVQRGMPIQTLVKYFKQVPQGWQVDSSLRAMVRFETFNLLEPFNKFGTFDLIFCRNVLIYFDPPTKGKIMDRMALSLARDGYLFLGAAETTLGYTKALEPKPEARGAYGRTS